MPRMRVVRADRVMVCTGVSLVSGCVNIRAGSRVTCRVDSPPAWSTIAVVTCANILPFALFVFGRVSAMSA